MKLKNLITAASLALLPLTAGAATLVVPAAGSFSSANGSIWKSELTLHNTSSTAITLALTYHDQTGATSTAALNIPAQSTVSRDDIVRTLFQKEGSVGAIEILVNDADLNRLAVASRTYNVVGGGEFGQDIPVVRSTDAIAAGDVAVIAGPRVASGNRFNVGIYATTASRVKWDLIRADGSLAASKTIEYAAGTPAIYGVSSLFDNADLRDDDVVRANVQSGSAVIYGSIVNNASGDPSFVPGVRTRQQSAVNLIGVDRDENGSVDIAAHDNVLDSPVDAYTVGFPTFFRLVSDRSVTYEIISSTADARIIDSNGTVQMVASAALAGKTGELKVRATAADGSSTVFTIPVRFF